MSSDSESESDKNKSLASQRNDLINNEDNTNKSQKQNDPLMIFNESTNQLPQIEISDQDNSVKNNKSVEFNDFLKPLPILPRGQAYQEGQEIPKWKRKQTFEDFKNDQKAITEKIDEDLDNLEEDTILTIENDDQKEENINEKHKKLRNKQKDIQSSEDVQEKLMQYADQIQLQNFVTIDKSQYPNLFKYPIYESYKPQNLSQTRKLLQIYLQKSAKQDNSDKMYDTLDKDQYNEYYNYTMKQLDTQLPSFINQHTLLQFDSHFECGNLDSAYLVQENEYNLLMKVDTNTKGNSLWFYFKVCNGRPGQVVQFNILNFSRDLKTFYQQGMNVQVLKESNAKEQKWEQDKCFSILFQQSNELIKSYKSSGSPKYYYELSFKYKFETAEENQLGSAVYFAYSVPFTYSQLIRDLQQTKQNLQLLPHQIKQIGEDIQVKNSTESLHNEIKIQTRQRLNQFELQHLEIRNQGLKLLKLNTLEKALLNEQQSLTDIREPDHTKNKSNFSQNLYKDEFEIKSGNILYKQEILAYSVGGLPIFQLTITNRCLQGQLKYKKRKVLYICSRVHAGETSASYIMQNIIYELTNNTSSKYDTLLQNYIVKLVPIINVDGVSIGNGRASLVGLDLNRRWTNPNPIIHPEVYFLKRMLKKLNTQYEKGVQIFCDLHGHNKKLNSFVYGCHKAANSGLLSWTKTRLLPKIIASFTPMFNYKDCRFKIDKCKLNTARVVCWNELKITNSFTFEVSLFGKQDFTKDDEYGVVSQMSIKDYHNLGESILISIAQYNNLEPELELEFQQTNGWLKVTKLNDVAGKAARDKIQEENNYQNTNNSIVKKSQRLKRNIQQIQQQQQQNPPKAELRHRKSFIETAYNTQSGNKQSVVSAVAAHNQQVLKRKQSFAQSTTTASGTNQINSGKGQFNNIAPKLSIKSAKYKNINYQKRKLSSNQNMVKSGSSLNDDDSLSSDSKSTLMYHSTLSSNWRDFFEQKEIDKAINLAQQDQILEEENEESESDQEKGGSDSEPSEDNIDPNEFYGMMNQVFSRDEQISFDQLIQQKDLEGQVQNVQNNNQIQTKSFKRQSSRNNLQNLSDLEDQIKYQELMQSPPYNFKRKQEDPARQSKDQYYDLQLMKQNQSNRIKLLQEQLEELERQKRQQLIIQQQLNQSQSSEQQINFQLQQYKNPVTSQGSKTAYQGWNQTKNKLSSANISSNSTTNFGVDNLVINNANQKTPERQRQLNFPYNKQHLSTNNRIKSSNLFDPNKQKMITEQIQAHQNIFNQTESNQQTKDLNRQKVDLSNNIFAQQMYKHHGSISPDRDNQKKYSIKVNMLVNEIQRLNNSKNINIVNQESHQLKNSILLPEQHSLNTINQYKTQQNFYNSSNIYENQIPNLKNIYNSSSKQNNTNYQLDRENNQLRLRSFEKHDLNLNELKTPVKANISPIMFKRFEMQRFPSTHKRDGIQISQDQTSPKNSISNNNDYSIPNKSCNSNKNQNQLDTKGLPQIQVNRAQTQVQSRKQAVDANQSTSLIQI